MIDGKLSIALAGNPNSGKTTLFNSLTKSTAHVGNWPGVTVDKRDGEYRAPDKSKISITDLPGIYSLSPYTPEEVVSRNFLLETKGLDGVIDIIDATNLERNLYLTTQLLEMDIPVIIALNMMDVLEKNEEHVDIEKLSRKLGVKVVPISALKEENLDKLMDVVREELKNKRKGVNFIEDQRIEALQKSLVNKYQEEGVTDPLFHTAKLIENDEIEVAAHPKFVEEVTKFKENFNDDLFGDDLEALSADLRYKAIANVVEDCVDRKFIPSEKETVSDKIDKVLTNRWAGIPIFLIILFLVFHIVFSEDFLYLGAAGALGGFTDFPGSPFEGVFIADGALMSPGVIIMNFLGGCFGLLTDALNGWFESMNVAAWVPGLICDGIIGGVGGVIGFLPQILLLYLFLSILEDSGYMARVAFILDRIFRRFGLSGRAFVPMIMGFGCSLPAMSNTRTLATENERVATIRVIPFFTCGAKLPILTAVAGALAGHFGLGNVDLITFSLYVTGIVVALVAAVLMRETTLKDDTPAFIMELPAYHLPQAKALGIHVWEKLKAFIKKAFTIILFTTIIIWCLSHFSFDWKFLEDTDIDKSILAGIGMLVQPLFTPLGFGSQLGNYGWVFAVAAVTGLLAKENVVGTFGTLAACLTGVLVDVEAAGGDVEAVMAMVQATGISAPGLFSFIIFNMFTIPCFAAVAVAKAELPKNRFGSTLWFWLFTSYLCGMMVYLVGSPFSWWSVFIFLALFAVAIVLIVLYNKHKLPWLEKKVEEHRLKKARKAN